MNIMILDEKFLISPINVLTAVFVLLIDVLYYTDICISLLFYRLNKSMKLLYSVIVKVSL